MTFLVKFWNKTISAKTENSKECKLLVQNDFTHVSLDVLGECVFGYKFNSIEAGDTPVSRAFNDLFTGLNPTVAINRKVVEWFPFLERFLKGTIKRKEALKITDKTIKEVKNIIKILGQTTLITCSK